MRIIKQAKLRLTEGASDKVYEVDLCQSADDEYVVNFRFGRHGTRLREGTKTYYPVDLEAAERMYERLVSEKTNKGYKETSSPTSPSDEAPDEPQTIESNEHEPALATPEQEAAILKRLSLWSTTTLRTQWSLSRVIWRAGQLQIKAALPLIDSNINSALTSTEQYSIAWTVAQIADKGALSLSILNKLADITDKKPVKRMIREAQIRCMSQSEAQQFLHQLHSDLSADVREKLGTNELPDFLKSDAFYQHSSAPEHLEILYTTSLLDESLRSVIIDFATHVDIGEGSFRLLRLLYKLSEARQDGLLYGTLVNRLEIEATRSWKTWEKVGHRYKQVRNGVFGQSTKRYLKRRSVRNLTKMGEDGNVASYITLATGILTSACDKLPVYNQQEVKEYAYNSDTNRYEQVIKYAPRYAHLHCFTWLLRGKSRRLAFSKQSRNWSYLKGFSPQNDVKESREEPYPELWDQAPDAIIHLLSHAKLDEVHRFAHAVWLDNPSFFNEVKVTDIVHFIGSSYEDTKRLGLELVERFWDPAQPNYSLIEALILCDLDEARTIGFTYLTQVIDTTLTQPEFLAEIFTSPRTDTHERLRGLYLNKKLPNFYAEISELFPADAHTPRSAQLAVETLTLLKSPHTADTVEQSELDRLLASTDEEAMWLALHYYQDYAHAGKEIAEQIIIDAIESEHGSIRSQGVKLLESFSDEQLIQQADLIASCCASKSSELRQGILPVLERLVKAQPKFGLEMAESLYPYVLRKEASEGVHDDILAILLGPLRSSLTVIPDDSFRRILKSKYAAAHILGLHLLEQETTLADEQLLQLLEWANHPHFELRKKVISHLDENPERLLMQLSETRQLVESEWDEVREFSMNFLRERVPEERWTVEALVDLCDSVKPLVQDFGREMITKRFREEDGEVYMTKLSQHPTREMQQFATHFLTQTASDQPELILELEFYFRTVMGAVSTGRVAKDRVYAFLRQESQKNQDIAVMAIKLWHDHAATCAIGDKADCLEAIMNTQRIWPEINLEFYSDLKLVELEERKVRA